MKWMYGLVAASMMMSGGATANDRVRELVLAVDKEAIAVRERASQEIQRQVEIEAKRLERWIRQWERDAEVAERLYDETLFALESHLNGLQLLTVYVKEVASSPDEGVATPMGVRSARALTHDINDAIQLDATGIVTPNTVKV